MNKDMMEAGLTAAPSKEKPAFLQSKFQIGSCKAAVGYRHKETVFHPDDIPADKRKNKAEVMEFKRKPALDKKKDWNSSVYVQRKVCEDKRIRANFENDRANMHQYNFRAEVLPNANPAPPPKDHRFKVNALSNEEMEKRHMDRGSTRINQGISKRTEEMLTNPRLEGKESWNSTTVLMPADKKKLLDDLQAKSKANSEKKKAQLKNYCSPAELARRQREEQRRVIKEQRAMIVGGQIASGATLGPESQSQSRAKGGGGTPAFATFNRLAKNPTQKTKRHEHSGTWEFNQGEQKWMWSDTGSYEKDSPGDVVTMHNPYAYNFASPTTHG